MTWTLLLRQTLSLTPGDTNPAINLTNTFTRPGSRGALVSRRGSRHALVLVSGYFCSALGHDDAKDCLVFACLHDWSCAAGQRKSAVTVRRQGNSQDAGQFRDGRHASCGQV